MRIALFTP